jgi:SAM-dependent methyltransferase
MVESHPQDHFSAVSSHYATSRPGYPPALFEWLASVAPARSSAWDCACGSGQASGSLAEHFSHVIATDLSAEQLRQARPHPRIDYRVAPAEASGLDAASVDLVIVAQALHWLQSERFYAEASRVLRPGGVLAVWSYGTGSLDNTAADATLQDFYHNIVGPYWPAERVLVESGYRGLPFPQPELAVPPLRMEQAWSLAALMGYVSSWSATARYIRARGTDPVPRLYERLLPDWGDPELRLRFQWPLSIRAAVINPI